MLDRLTRSLYERLGLHYRVMFLITQGPASLFVVMVMLALLASYYDPSVDEALRIAAWVSVFAMAGLSYALIRSKPDFTAVLAWRERDEPSEAETLEAWDAAANLPMRAFRRSTIVGNAIAVVPSLVVVVSVLDLGWTAAPVLLAAFIVAAVYATVLTYSLAELVMRPVVEEIAASLPDEFAFERNGLPIRKRMKIALPTFTILSGLIVAAVVTDHGGTDLLALSVLASIVAGILLSFELATLLSRAITDPISRLRKALALVRAGDYSARVPVLSTDELGELSADFNRMAAGLAEREEIREAFGTYVDKEVARFILDGRFPESGVEVDVSIMFCDVRGFTSFAEQAEPAEVVAALNALFETIVPIIDRHGGHVDKFIGDGLLAVFGAPEGYADHADRAVAAGLDTVRAVNRPDSELRIAVGINTGPVIAGSIGGAGRLNFSVIGDAVNVAARVEAATRDTGDDMLVTAATRDALERPVPLVSRGTIALKGKAEPLELLAPVVVSTPVPDEKATTTTQVSS